MSNHNVTKLLDVKDPAGMKTWADILYNRFPIFPNWSTGAFFHGVMTVGQRVPRFLVPELAWKFNLTHLKATFQTGTVTGLSKIDVSLISRGVTTLLGTLELEALTATDEVVSIELAHPLPIVADDLIGWDCTLAGGHAAVTAYVVGSQAS